MSLKENLSKNAVLGLIPARGGSKSVPLKNIASLAGRPLIQYCVESGKSVIPEVISRMVCSTDHPEIKAVCNRLGVEVIDRPAELATDVAPVEDAVRHVLLTLGERDGEVPEIVVLFQPTSPFVCPEHIKGVVDILKRNPMLDTCQTITQVSHNMHALNQRTFVDGKVAFRFAEERRRAYNKQLKPIFYRFGNLLAFRSSSVLGGNSCFGPNSGGVVIEPAYSLDVDGPQDFIYAEYLLEKKIVCLPWLIGGSEAVF